MNMKKLTLGLKTLLNLSEEIVVFVVVINLKFLLMNVLVKVRVNLK